MVLLSFLPSVSGMEAQTQALNTASMNIANMNTVGYKGQDTLFYTMLGSQPVVSGQPSVGYSDSKVAGRADISSVGAYDRTKILTQGLISSTGNPYDVAINSTANGFFVVKNADGQSYYTRAGDFNIQPKNGIPYLVNNSGYYVQGFQGDGKGGFSGSLSDIKIDYPNQTPSVPTTNIGITANVPASGVDSTNYGLLVYGPNNDGKNMNMVFTKDPSKVNTWNVNFTIDDGTVTSAPISAVFDSSGQLVSPKNFNIAIDWNDGSANQVAMDISKMTQFDGSNGIQNISNNGYPSGYFTSAFIDSDGIVKARYTNGQTINYAKLGVMSFTAPENLTNVDGTMFAWNSAVGASSYLIGPNTSANNLLSAGSLENSTTNVEQDFANMLVVNRAYSMNTKTFTTVNEMTQLLVNLKT